MANIFISYNREGESSTKDLVDDISGLGHSVWFDQELSGGQDWWNKILETVRNCDVFIFVLNNESLNSPACSLEYGYANELNKTILPILVGEGVSANLLPSALSQIQFIDYRKRDRDSILRLAKAFTTVHPSPHLPNPLPLPPKAPISHLGGFAKQIKKTVSLSYEEQSVLVVDLKRSLRDPENTKDAQTLLKKLRNRRDLFANIAEEIDELLEHLAKITEEDNTHEMFGSEVQKKKFFSTPIKAIIAGLAVIITMMTSLFFVYDLTTDEPLSPVHIGENKKFPTKVTPEFSRLQMEKSEEEKIVTINKNPDKTTANNPKTSLDEDYFFNKGYGLYSLKRYDAAIAAFDKTIAINPNYAVAFYNKGLALHKLKRYGKAVAAFDKAIAINPNYTESYNNKGVSLKKLEKYVQAIAAYDKAIAIDPNYAFAFYNKGSVMYTVKLYEEAIAAFDKAIVINPNYFDTFYMKGLSLHHLKRYDEAIAVYDEAILINPDHIDTLNNKGLALSYIKRYHEAIAAYDKAILINPNYIKAFNNKGLALSNLKRYEEAIDTFDKAILIDPNYTDAIYNKGITLYDLKRYDEAIAAYDKAITIDPDYYNAFYRKAYVYVLQNNKEKLLTTLKKAIRSNKKFKEWTKTDEHFKKYWNDKDFKKLVN